MPEAIRTLKQAPQQRHHVKKEPGNCQSQEGFPSDITQPAAGGFQENTRSADNSTESKQISIVAGELICMQ